MIEIVSGAVTVTMDIVVDTAEEDHVQGHGVIVAVGTTVEEKYHLLRPEGVMMIPRGIKAQG